MSAASSVPPYDKSIGHLPCMCSFIDILYSMNLRNMRIGNDDIAMQVTGKLSTGVKPHYSLKLVWAFSDKGLATSIVRELRQSLEIETNRGRTLQ